MSQGFFLSMVLLINGLDSIIKSRRVLKSNGVINLKNDPIKYFLSSVLIIVLLYDIYRQTIDFSLVVLPISILVIALLLISSEMYLRFNIILSIHSKDYGRIIDAIDRVMDNNNIPYERNQYQSLFHEGYKYVLVSGTIIKLQESLGAGYSLVIKRWRKGLSCNTVMELTQELGEAVRGIEGTIIKKRDGKRLLYSGLFSIGVAVAFLAISYT